MIRDQFLTTLLQLVGRDDSSSEISAATDACDDLLPEEIELLSEAMWWSSAEQDLMTLLIVFYRTHNRAPSWRELRASLKEHVLRCGSLMSPEQRTAFERLLPYYFQQLAQALLAASVLHKEAKTAQYKEVKPIKPETESTKPATPETAKRVQQITQETPKPPEPIEPEIPKAIQQTKPEKRKPVQPLRPEIPDAPKPIKPEIQPI